MNTLLSFLKNPLIKSIAAVAVGAAATAVDNAIQNPTGGMATALAANPSYAMIFAGAALFVHNLIDHAAANAAASAPTTPASK